MAESVSTKIKKILVEEEEENKAEEKPEEPAPEEDEDDKEVVSESGDPNKELASILSNIKGKLSKDSIKKEFRDNCSGELVIPMNITELGERALSQFKKVTTIVLHDGIKSVGWGCFSECPALEKIKNFPYRAEVNAGNLFLGCHSLKSVPYIDSHDVDTGAGTYTGCHNLKSNISISGKFVDPNCVSGCKKVTQITFVNCSIPKLKLTDCDSLKDIYIDAKTVKDIAPGCFDDLATRKGLFGLGGKRKTIIHMRPDNYELKKKLLAAVGKNVDYFAYQTDFLG